MHSSSVAAQVPFPRSAVSLATPAQKPPAHRRSELTTTVPRQYVHRAAVGEVFLTHWETDESDGFIVDAQWPRSHVLFAPRYKQQDPLLIAETIRQTGALLSHAAFGVPLGYQFLMWDLSYAMVPGALVEGPAPTEVRIRIACHDITRRGKQLASMRYRAEIWHGQVRIAVGSAGFNCTSPAVYRRIRGKRAVTAGAPVPPAIDPALVGRETTASVVLAPVEPADLPGTAGQGRTAADPPPHHWLLRVDTEHPIFFDHPLDHVPGMLLMEAARQAAQCLATPDPVHAVELAGVFIHYAELDVPCVIEAAPGPPTANGNASVDVVGIQNDEAVFTCTVGTQPLR